MVVPLLPVNPTCTASSHAFWRAATISPSRSIATWVSSAATWAVPVHRRRQELHPFLEIEGGQDAVQGQTELHHGNCDIRLNAHNDGLGSAQPGGLGNGPHGPRG